MNDQSKLTQDNASTQVNADSAEIDLPGAWTRDGGTGFTTCEPFNK
jgi:hypothetical protein